MSESENIAEIRRSVQALCADFPGAYWREKDSARAYPGEFVDALTKAGFLAALIPEAYGGSGLTLSDAAIIMEEIQASGCNGASAHAQMYIMNTLLKYGSEAQKQEYLPRIATGELRLQAFGVSEPTSGTDTLSLRTVAVRDGDEYVINGQRFNTQVLAEGIKKKEAEHFTDKLTGEERPPYLRVSDNNLIVINDLWQLHGLRFIATRKDDADAALNNMKIMLQNEKIIINPRCRTLITHLESAVWNKSKSSFERSADFGHFDAIDSLKYMVRNVQQQKNPYPNGYLNKYNENHFTALNKPQYSHYSQFATITNLPSSKKKPFQGKF